MLTEHLHRLSHRVPHGGATADEHKAVIELLVLVIFADGKVTQEELDALEQFDSDHSDWDEGAFSVKQYLGEAVSRVRSSIDDENEIMRLIATDAGRIESADLREQAALYCRELADVDGRAKEESALLAAIFKALH
ncbi:MAG TPA: hypothetical protein VMU77_00220 [Acidimicrobiales bacterium]|nr:hypothetical protein [Acidimicrobiales bacterium]